MPRSLQAAAEVATLVSEEGTQVTPASAINCYNPRRDRASTAELSPVPRNRSEITTMT